MAKEKTTETKHPIHSALWRKKGEFGRTFFGHSPEMLIIHPDHRRDLIDEIADKEQRVFDENGNIWVFGMLIEFSSAIEKDQILTAIDLLKTKF